MALPPLLEHLTTSPLMIDDAAQDLFQASIAHVVSHEHAADFLSAILASEDDDFWPTTSDDWRAAYRPYNVTKDGTLQIPIMGVLLHRFPYQLGRWATGYQYIERALARGLEDGNVKRIAFIHDTPGGEVAGCFECADKIYEARGKKPSRGFAADHAYSAGYATISSTGSVSVTKSGGVGSIGVVTAHVEYSEALKDMGVKVTFVYAGKHKVDGNPYEKLSPETKARWQARIDKIYGVFTSTVARNRGMEEKAVRATEALTYDADEAMSVGLADRVGALEDEMVIFSSEEDAQPEDEEMATFTQEQHDAALAEARTTAKAEGVAEGTAAGTTAGAVAGSTAERTRVNAILGSDEGKKRPKAALSAALKTNMTLEEATAFLGELPEEKAEAAAPAGGKPAPKTAASHFDAAMSQDNPDVGADTEQETLDANSPEAMTNSILASFGRETGIKPKAKTN